MREIKFRVFDRCHKSMHIVGTDSHDKLSCFDGEVQYYNLQNGEGSGEHGDYTLMQYTGLKDKNGVEIYESDVLRFVDFDTTGGHRDDREYTGIVKWMNGMFEIWNKPNSEFYNTDGGFVLQYVRLQDDELEIIGNIYENEELLEQDNERSS